MRGRSARRSTGGSRLTPFELAPGASGWLGTTAGVTDEGRFVALARFAFESEDAARRNSDRPEQGQWWAETSKLFTDEPTFRDSQDVVVDVSGDPDSAGFVQVIQGRTSDPAPRPRELAGRGLPRVGLIPPRHHRQPGGRTRRRRLHHGVVLHLRGGGAGRGPWRKEPPPELKAQMEEMDKLSIGMPEFLDLKQPWLYSQRRRSPRSHGNAGRRNNADRDRTSTDAVARAAQGYSFERRPAAGGAPGAAGDTRGARRRRRPGRRGRRRRGAHLHPEDSAGADTLAREDAVAAALTAVRAATAVSVGITTGAWMIADPADRGERDRRVDAAGLRVGQLARARRGGRGCSTPRARVGAEASLWHSQAAHHWAMSPYRDACCRVLIELPDGLDAAETEREADRLLDLVRSTDNDAPVLLHAREARAAGRRCATPAATGCRRASGWRTSSTSPRIPAPDNTALVVAARAPQVAAVSAWRSHSGTSAAW